MAYVSSSSNFEEILEEISRQRDAEKIKATALLVKNQLQQQKITETETVLSQLEKIHAEDKKTILEWPTFSIYSVFLKSGCIRKNVHSTLVQRGGVHSWHLTKKVAFRRVFGKSEKCHYFKSQSLGTVKMVAFIGLRPH